MQDTSKEEILEAIGLLADQVEAGKTEFKSEISSLKSQMVTKSYLDDKLSDFRGDIVSMFRKEDQKVNRLVTILADKQAISPAETKDVLSFRLFR